MEVCNQPSISVVVAHRVTAYGFAVIENASGMIAFQVVRVSSAAAHNCGTMLAVGNVSVEVAINGLSECYL